MLRVGPRRAFLAWKGCHKCNPTSATSAECSFGEPQLYGCRNCPTALESFTEIARPSVMVTCAVFNIGRVQVCLAGSGTAFETGLDIHDCCESFSEGTKSPL